MIRKYNLKHVALVVIAVFILSGCKKEKNRICDVYDGTPGYAIGRMMSVSGGFAKAKYTYSYEVDGVTYEAVEKFYGIGQKDAMLIGNQYVVVYSLSDPANSDLNTDFPIESDAEFLNFIIAYFDGPPAPDFPNSCD